MNRLDHVYGLPGEPETDEVVLLRWTGSHHLPNRLAGESARFVHKTNRGLYVVVPYSGPLRELRVRRHHLQRGLPR
jgi:hypothetical protein